MAVLSLEEIKERVVRPVSSSLVAEGAKMELSHKLHINGDRQLLKKYLTQNNEVETKETYELRLRSTEVITKTVYAPIINYITKALDLPGHTYQYHFRNDDDEELSQDFENYLNERTWDGMDFYESIHSTLKKAHFTDFQGLLYVDLPGEESNLFGEAYFDFFSSNQIHDVDITGHKVEFVIFKEEIIIKEKGTIKDRWWRYYCIDDEKTLVLRKKADAVEFDTTFPRNQLPNLLGYVPAFVLSHEAVSIKNNIERTSLVGQSIGLANLMLNDHSEHELNKRLHAFQEKWVEGKECPSCHGVGKVFSETDEGQTIETTCKTCNGVGGVYPTGPDKVFYRKPPVDKLEPELKNDPAGYIHKDLDPTRYLDEQESKWGKAIPVSVFSQELQGNISPETATAKEIDDDDKQVVVRRFLKFIEVTVRNVVDSIGKLRYGDLYEGSTVLYNKNPQMRKVSELEQDYDQKKKAGMNDAVLFECLTDIVNARYRNDPIRRHREMLLLHLIPFPTKTDEELSKMPVSEEDRRFRAYFNDYVNRFEREVSKIEKFGVLLEFPQQLEAIREVLVSYNQEPVEPQGGVEEPEDSRQAEAQANLRGSVGGVQGLLEVQKSVQEGTTNYNAALEILSEIYGFDEQKARKILGKINNKQNTIQNEQENQVA